MKKNLFLFGFIMLVAMSVNAQYFAGGALGYSYTGGKTDDGTTQTDKNSVTSFTFEPFVGYMLSEDLWVGMKLGYESEREKTPGATEIIDKTKSFGFAPFVEYHMFHLNKFSLGLIGKTGLYFGNQKTEAGGTTTDGPKTTTFEFTVNPNVLYELNDRITLVTEIGGLGLGYYNTTEKEEIGGETHKDKTSQFGFGVNTEDIFTTGFITVGAIVKF